MPIISSKIKAKHELLEMAKEYEKQGKTQHAIECCEAVIEDNAESKEADEARELLFEIAEKNLREGKKHAAFYLFNKLSKGKAGSHDGRESRG